MHRSEQGRDGPPGIVSEPDAITALPPNRISKGPPRELESMLERYKHSCVRFPFTLIVELQRLTERRMKYPNPGAEFIGMTLLPLSGCYGVGKTCPVYSGMTKDVRVIASLILCNRGCETGSRQVVRVNRVFSDTIPGLYFPWVTCSEDRYPRLQPFSGDFTRRKRLM